MLINWFTVIAQLVNFLILIVLLHRFLYRPIVTTIRLRQTEITHRWQEAEEQQEAAKAEAISYEQKQQYLQQRKQEIMAQAREEAEQEYDNLVKQARQEVKQKQADWTDAIAQQQERFLDKLQQKVTEQIYKIARHALRELADVQLEQQAIVTFIHRLENLEERELHKLAQSLEKSDKGLVIYSSFEMNSETREMIINCLQQQQIYQDNNLRFATNPDLICGIELQASNYKIVWNLQEYLQCLEQHLANVLSQPEHKLEIKNQE